mgnify:FL=1
MKKPAPKRRAPAASAVLAGSETCRTVGDWLGWAEALYESQALALGQIATTAHDEALYLLLHTLGIPMDCDESVLRRRVSPVQAEAVREIFRRRAVDHTPAAYLTKEALLGDYRFYVDERVLIPRSYFLELIPEQIDQWLPDPKKVTRVVDVCTGSACLAILLAHHYPQAEVDAIDLSPDALDVAKINVRDHALEKRLHLYRSDVFDSVPQAKYDVILSNPPYEPTAHVDAMPVEFHREPRLALDGGEDGLDIIRKLLVQARTRLKPHGIVVIEVGGLRDAMDAEFGALEPHWLHTLDGSDCVCLIKAKKLFETKI